MFNVPHRAALAAVLCLSSVVAAPAALAQPASVTPESFALADGRSVPVERGVLMVPENRADPASRRIPLTFIRFKTTAANPGAPIVYLAGGPGGSGVETAKYVRAPIFLALTAVADVIAFDQRGTGASNGIPRCKAEAAFDRARTLNEVNWTDYYQRTLTKCLAEWRAAGVAVEGYTTDQNADDLEDLRKALGAPRLNLWGISYGSHLALATMRRHPGSIERVALSSVEGMDQTVKLPSATDAALERIGARPAATAVLGDRPLPAVMRRVHAQLDAKPITLTAKAEGGSAVTFRADSFPFRSFAGGMAKNPGGIGRLAGMYAALDGGQTDAVAQSVYEAYLDAPMTLSGMGTLMDIASGVSNARLKRMAREGGDSLLGYATNFPMPQMRGAVRGLDLGEAFRKEIKSDIPTLVFSGDLDVRTPLEEQATATAGLSRLSRVIVHGGGHDLFEAHPAVPGLLVDFFSGKTIETRDLTLP